MDPDTIWQAIFGQESNYGKDNKTSTTGAVGPGQIQPGTWAQYALPGENIHNYDDNIKVSKRIVYDYYNRYSGDPARIATAYFSGPGNVAPEGHPTPFLKDKHDPNRKYVSSYVSDINRRLNNMDNVPDILGSWGASPATQDQPVEDLLGSWSVPQVSVPLPRNRPEQAPIAAQKTGPETLPQFVNRLAAENQGEGFGQQAIQFGAGLMRGGGDVADTLAQGITSAGAKGANLLERLGVVSPETAQSVADWKARVGANIAADQGGYKTAGTLADIGRIGGQVLGSAPFLAPVAAAIPVAAPGLGALTNLSRSALQGGTLGAGTTALTSAASNEPLLDQVTQGGLAGAALGPAGRIAAGAGSKLAGLVGGAIDPYVAQLARTAKDQFGINVNPMQLANSNSMLRFMQSVLQRTPLTGFGPASRGQAADWEGALIKEMGASGNRVTPDLISRTQEKLSSQYKDINNNLGTIPADNRFLSTLNSVKKDTDVTRIRNIVDDINSKIDPKTGFISAKDHQTIMETNGKLDKALNSKLGSEVQDAKEIKYALDDVLKRTDPKLFAARKETDYKWAVMSALRDASKNSPTGGLSPNKVFSEFAHYDQGTNARNATKLGQIGKQFIGEPPSSGSMERILTGGLGLGVAGALGGIGWHEFDPENLQATLAKGGLGLAGLLALRYGASPVARSNILSNLLINKSLGVSGPNKIGNLLARTTIPAAALAYRQSP